MDNQEWLFDQLQKLAEVEGDFATRCLFEGAQRIVAEQSKRIQQANDELDGRVWSPNKW
ncbi:hypothetical protein [Lactobacillus sp. Sy-1]|uniref:hypothetical protein n=1 Tax=Lactobacillus sp. Sy-1 TaxID=2109645 RepID=UPI001C561CFE|nr:hypothetical protein [Lactobacillus sp. Sy-1]MBW1605194.1 hypothetical protein [Lactobacillus sp. Sy-1]